MIAQRSKDSPFRVIGIRGPKETTVVEAVILFLSFVIHGRHNNTEVLFHCAKLSCPAYAFYPEQSLIVGEHDFLNTVIFNAHRAGSYIRVIKEVISVGVADIDNLFICRHETLGILWKDKECCFRPF